MKNGIKEFSEGDFQELNHLKILSLSYNQIEEFPEDVFQDLSQLEILDVSNNPIEELPVEVLQKISQLRILRLDSSVQNIDEIRNVLAGPVRIQHRIPIK